MRPMVHEHPVVVDKGGPTVGVADDHAVARGLDFEFTSRGEVKLIAKRLWHDEPTGCINGSFHATMVFRVVFRVNDQPRVDCLTNRESVAIT